MGRRLVGQMNFKASELRDSGASPKSPSVNSPSPEPSLSAWQSEFPLTPFWAFSPPMTSVSSPKSVATPQSASEILWEKLHWTFQADKIGALVLKGATHGLAFKCRVDGEEFTYSWGGGAELKRWAKRWMRPRGNGRNALWVVMATGRALPPA